MVYTHMDERGRTVVFDAIIPSLGGGIHVKANPSGSRISDDEIPRLISNLQNYMSKRANQIARAAGK